MAVRDRACVGAVGLAMVIGGCGGQGGGDTGSRARTAPVPKPVATEAEALPSPADRCGDPRAPASTLRLRTRDGVALDAVEVGRGRAGAVFLHQSPSDLCDWWPFARSLAQAGVRALLLDLRCNGLSDCPTRSEAFTSPESDVGAAVSELRRRGAKRVTVVGASYGGATALVASSKLGRKVDAVASLSGEPRLSDELDVHRVIGRLRAPLLLVVAPGDQYVSVAQTRAMLRAAGARSKRLIVRPVNSGHGIDLLLKSDQRRRSALFGTLMSFIRSGTA